MKIILLGAPGVGKGTQAEIISDKYNIPQVSTGNILREAMKSGTEDGVKAKSFVDSGKLVPDEIVIGILRHRISQDDCKKGFILDGFPRTIAQAEALDRMGIEIDTVIDIEAPDGKVAQRMSGRRVCEKCGSTYHLVSKQPLKEGVCDRCAGALVQRKDDRPETVLDRLKVYHDQTEPLRCYYEKQGKLSSVNGDQPMKAVSAEIFAILGD